MFYTVASKTRVRARARGHNLKLLKVLYFKVFFRSSYLNSHWPESSDIRTKGNLESLMRSDTDLMPRCGLKVKI